MSKEESDTEQKQSSDGQNVTDDGTTLLNVVDAYKFALKHVNMKPDQCRQPLGMTTTTTKGGLVKVTEVTKASTAVYWGIEVDMYLLCANGRVCTGDPEVDLKPNENGLRMTLARNRRHPLNPQILLSFLGRYQRQLGCEYFLTRVNFIVCKPSALDIVEGKGCRANIGIGSDRSAIGPFGLRVGDSIIAVDYFPIRDKKYCDAQLRAVQNDIVDLTIECPPVAYVPVVKVKPPEATASFEDFSLSGDDDTPSPSPSTSTSASSAETVNQEAQSSLDSGLGLMEEVQGDPALGIPQVPHDIAKLIQPNALQLARKIITSKLNPAARLPPPKPDEPEALCLSSEPDHRAKLDKTVKAEKLQKIQPSKKSPAPTRTTKKAAPSFPMSTKYTSLAAVLAKAQMPSKKGT